VDSALGDIEVRQGLFSVETSTTSLGNPAYTLSVSNGATLQFYQNAVVLTKPVLLAAGATLQPASGSVVYGGPVTLAGNATFNVSGTSLTVTNSILGPGGFTKTSSGTLVLNGSSSYAGAATISSGKCIMNGQLNGGLTLNSGATVAFDIRNAAGDSLQVNGNLTLNNNSLSIVPLDNLQAGVPY